jgi:hypothetical protein
MRSMRAIWDNETVWSPKVHPMGYQSAKKIKTTTQSEAPSESTWMQSSTCGFALTVSQKTNEAGVGVGWCSVSTVAPPAPKPLGWGSWPSHLSFLTSAKVLKVGKRHIRKIHGVARCCKAMLACKVPPIWGSRCIFRVLPCRTLSSTARDHLYCEVCKVLPYSGNPSQNLPNTWPIWSHPCKDVTESEARRSTLCKDVTELPLHRANSCKDVTKSGAM